MSDTRRAPRARRAGRTEPRKKWVYLVIHVVDAVLTLYVGQYSTPERAYPTAPSLRILLKRFTYRLCAYGDKMVASTFDGAQGFSLGGGIKDMTHVQSLAAASGVDVPALEAARRHLVRAKEIKEGDAEVKGGVWDVASLVKAVREGAK